MDKRKPLEIALDSAMAGGEDLPPGVGVPVHSRPGPLEGELGQWTFIFNGDTREGFVSVVARDETAARVAARKVLIEDADDMSLGDPEEDRQNARDYANGLELTLATAVPMPKEGECLWFDYGYSD